MAKNKIVLTPYATPEEKYQELKRLTREQLQKFHPDANGVTINNERQARRWTRQLDVIERAWKTFKRRSNGN